MFMHTIRGTTGSETNINQHELSAEGFSAANPNGKVCHNQVIYKSLAYCMYLPKAHPLSKKRFKKQAHALELACPAGTP